MCQLPPPLCFKKTCPCTVLPPTSDFPLRIYFPHPLKWRRGQEGGGGGANYVIISVTAAKSLLFFGTQSDIDLSWSCTLVHSPL